MTDREGLLGYHGQGITFRLSLPSLDLHNSWIMLAQSLLSHLFLPCKQTLSYAIEAVGPDPVISGVSYDPQSISAFNRPRTSCTTPRFGQRKTKHMDVWS